MRLLSFTYVFFVMGAALLTYLLPLKIRAWALPVLSAAFLAFQPWECAASVLLISALCYAGGRWLEKTRPRKWPLIVLLALLFGFLLLFKLAPLVPALSFLQGRTPLGISYFTFMGAAYLVDVYRGKWTAERNPVRLAGYLAFFPLLSQGPIEDVRHLMPQLRAPHALDPAKFVSGVILMLWGFFKKLVVADRVGLFVGAVAAAAQEAPGWMILLAGMGYACQLYADFSGGIDIVRGTAGILGIDLLENFRRPFFSKTVGEYWRRWHITLGNWFRTYLFYPMVTSRAAVGCTSLLSGLIGKKTARVVPGAFASLIVFVLIGVWHGFSLNALWYGLYFGLLSALAMLMDAPLKAFKKRFGIGKSRWFHALCILRTLVLVVIAQFFAMAGGSLDGFQLIGRICTAFGADTFLQVQNTPGLTFSALEWIIAGIGLLLLLAADLLAERSENKGKGRLCDRLAGSPLYIRWPVMFFLLFAVLIFGKYGSGADVSTFFYAGF